MRTLRWPAALSSLACGLALAGCAYLFPELRETSDLYEKQEREIIALQIRNRQLQEIADRCADQAATLELYTQLVQAFTGTEVQIARRGPHTEVTIPSSLLFAGAGTEVRQEAARVLDLLGLALQRHADFHVWIIGHTDDRPLSGPLKRDFGTTWELSAARAAAVVRRLTEGYELTPARFTAAGRAGFEPVGESDTPAGDAQNRRIVVLIGPREAGW